MKKSQRIDKTLYVIHVNLHDGQHIPDQLRKKRMLSYTIHFVKHLLVDQDKGESAILLLGKHAYRLYTELLLYFVNSNSHIKR